MAWTKETAEFSADELGRCWKEQQPLIVRGAASRWPAARRWSKAYLASQLGDREVLVRRYDPQAQGSFLQQCINETRKLSFAEYLDSLEDATWALRESWELFEGTDLARDLRLRRLLPGHKFAFYLWCGPPGYVTGLHADLPDLSLLIHLWGSKRVTLIPPDQEKWLYVNTPDGIDGGLYSEVNVPEPDLEKFPLYQNTTPEHLTLGPGDLLYIPRGWWHYVSGDDVTLSVTAVQETLKSW